MSVFRAIGSALSQVAKALEASASTVTETISVADDYMRDTRESLQNHRDALSSAQLQAEIEEFAAEAADRAHTVATNSQASPEYAEAYTEALKAMRDEIARKQAVREAQRKKR